MQKGNLRKYKGKISTSYFIRAVVPVVEVCRTHNIADGNYF
jgi:hypothetical protein